VGASIPLHTAVVGGVDDDLPATARRILPLRLGRQIHRHPYLLAQPLAVVASFLPTHTGRCAGNAANLQVPAICHGDAGLPHRIREDIKVLIRGLVGTDRIAVQRHLVQRVVVGVAGIRQLLFAVDFAEVAHHETAAFDEHEVLPRPGLQCLDALLQLGRVHLGGLRVLRLAASRQCSKHGSGSPGIERRGRLGRSSGHGSVPVRVVLSLAGGSGKRADDSRQERKREAASHEPLTSVAVHGIGRMSGGQGRP